MAITIGTGWTMGAGWTISDIAAEANDPYFMYNSLLLPGNGTNLAQNNTFLDGSTNNFTITRNGNTTQGTYSPYGSNWSNYFDGSGDYLTAANNAAFNFGTGSFTVECWVNLTAYTANGPIIDFGNGNSTTRLALIQANSSGSFMWYQGTSGPIITSSIAVSLNTWNHVAIVRNGTACTMYINGISAGTATNSQSYSDANCFIGKLNDSSVYYISGYLSNLRVVKGTAVYTSNFTPSTTPLTAIANTSLLTCQSNRFIDTSTNAFAITVNGNTNIQRFSPFEPSAAYDTSTIGGSGYFDGTGDNLSAPNNSAFNLNGVSFTVECWVYWNSLAGEQNILEQFTGPSGPGWTFYKFTPGTPPYGTIDFYGGGSSINSGVTPVAGQWYHLAVSRNNSTGTTSFYVNGTRTSTATFGVDSSASTALLVGVRSGGTGYINGYIEDVRIVRGSYVYDPTATTITIPSAPLTAVANTQLLLGFTNAGITDSAMINNLETVGDAKISTTQSKFGGSSMYFDGTGDWLVTSPNPNLSLGTGDFTIEAWVYLTSGSAYQYLIGATATGGMQVGLNVPISGTPTIAVATANGSWILNFGASITIPSATWTHVAVTRSGTTNKAYINGVQLGSSITDATSWSFPNNTLQVGATTSVAPLNGYIDDLRITKGYARYTATFTPPTSAFPLY